MKLVRFTISFTTLVILTSCASDWDTYTKTTDYNLMQCAKMCSTGNIAMVEKFNCACNQRMSNASNLNYSNAHGNTLNVYPNYGPSRKPSAEQHLMNGMQGLQNYDTQMYNRWSNELQAPSDTNNFQPMNWYKQ